MLKTNNSSPYFILSSGSYGLGFMLHVTHLYLFIATQPLFHLFSYKFLLPISCFFRYFRMVKNLNSTLQEIMQQSGLQKRVVTLRQVEPLFHKNLLTLFISFKGRSTQRLLRFHNYGRLIQILGCISGKHCVPYSKLNHSRFANCTTSLQVMQYASNRMKMRGCVKWKLTLYYTQKIQMDLMNSLNSLRFCFMQLYIICFSVLICGNSHKSYPNC